MRYVLAVVGLLAGCATAPSGFYYRTSDGVRGDATPEIFNQFTVDKTVCLGEKSKTRASMTADDFAGYDLETVMRGCMASRGWIVR